MIKVSIVILNWNGLPFLKQFLPILADHSPPDLSRIVVADNGSTDGSAQWLMENHPGILLMTLDRNHGYAEGYNLALKQIDTPFAVLLNTDVEVTGGWLEPLLEQMDNPLYGTVMPKMRNGSTSRVVYLTCASLTDWAKSRSWVRASARSLRTSSVLPSARAFLARATSSRV